MRFRRAAVFPKVDVHILHRMCKSADRGLSRARVEPAAGLTPWAGRVLPVIGFALQAGSGLPPSGVM